MQSIDLTGNNLEKINLNTFAGLVDLNELYLRNNYIKFIEDSAFFDLHELTNLDLASNNLQAINSQTLLGLEKVIALSRFSSSSVLTGNARFACLG